MTDNPFSTKLEHLQLAWDSVSSGLFKECPKKYELLIIRGWQSREQNIDTDFGIFLHEARARYAYERGYGWDHETALEAALDYLLTATWDERAQRPWQGDERKNRFTLCRTLVWYLDHWKEDPLTTLLRADGKPMVEVSFRFEMGVRASTGEEFVLCGHLDRVGDYAGTIWVNDLKSTKSSLDEGSSGYFFSGYSPDNQISLYSYASQIVLAQRAAGVMLDGAQVAQSFSRFARAPITRTQSQITEWLDDFKEMLERAEKYARRGHWPMNDRACFRCQFRRVCALPPASRQGILEKEYVKREWNPLAVRGE